MKGDENIEFHEVLLISQKKIFSSSWSQNLKKKIFKIFFFFQRSNLRNLSGELPKISTIEFENPTKSGKIDTLESPDKFSL